MSGQMSKGDAARIQSSQAKSGNDPGFASRAQSAGDKNANAANSGGKATGGSTQQGGKK